MKHTFAKALAAVAVCLVAASCVTTEPRRADLPELTFSHLVPHGLAVAQVEVASEAPTSTQAPHIEATAPVSPETALRRWAAHRLAAAGGTEVARLVIATAALTETPLKVRSGLKGAFYKDQSVRYDAEVSAVLHIVQGGGAPVGSAEATARRSRTLAEDASVNDRRRAQFDLVEAVLTDFDREMEKSLRAHLGRWLK